MKNIIELIKQKRKLLGWSLKDTAEKFGLTTTGYAKIENGETSITLDRLYQIAEIFGVSVGELLGLEGGQSVPNGEQASKIEALEREVRSLEREMELHKNLKEQTEENLLGLVQEIARLLGVESRGSSIRNIPVSISFLNEHKKHIYLSKIGEVAGIEDGIEKLFVGDTPLKFGMKNLRKSSSISIHTHFPIPFPKYDEKTELFLCNFLDERLYFYPIFNNPIISLFFEKKLIKHHYWLKYYEYFKKSFSYEDYRILRLFQQKINSQSVDYENFDWKERCKEVEEALEWAKENYLQEQWDITVTNMFSGNSDFDYF